MRRLALAAAVALAPSLAAAQFATVAPTPPQNDASNNRIASIGYVKTAVAAGSQPSLAPGAIWIGSAASAATAQILSGDLTVSNSGVVTLATVNSNVGSFGSASQCVSLTVNAKGLITAASAATCAPTIGSVTGFGAGILAALQANVGSAGAPVLFNGAGGTPSGIVLTNGTGLPISGVSGFGTGVAAALAVNTGTAGSPVVNGGALGTPSSGNGSNLTSVPTTALTGALQAAQEPAHTGDCTNTAGSLALNCLKTNGVNFTSYATAAVGQLPGIASATAASAGNIGEVISSTVLAGSAVSFVNATPKDITSVSLTTGEWACWGNAFTANNPTSITGYEAWIDTTSATPPTRPNGGADTLLNFSIPASSNVGAPVGQIDLVITGPTTVYLGSTISFTGSATQYGFLGCRRTH